MLEPPPCIQAAANQLPFARTPGGKQQHQLDINSRPARHERIRYAVHLLPYLMRVVGEAVCEFGYLLAAQQSIYIDVMFM